MTGIVNALARRAIPETGTEQIPLTMRLRGSTTEAERVLRFRRVLASSKFAGRRRLNECRYAHFGWIWGAANYASVDLSGFSNVQRFGTKAVEARPASGRAVVERVMLGATSLK